MPHLRVADFKKSDTHFIRIEMKYKARSGQFQMSEHMTQNVASVESGKDKPRVARMRTL